MTYVFLGYDSDQKDSVSMKDISMLKGNRQLIIHNGTNLKQCVYVFLILPFYCIMFVSLTNIFYWFCEQHPYFAYLLVQYLP